MQFQAFDKSYIDCLRAGDFAAQQHFVTYFSELIHLKLRGRLRSPQATEDVRQETLVRVLKALHSDKSVQPERLGPFVNSVCNHVLSEHYRSSLRTDSLDAGEESDFPAPTVDLPGLIATKQMEVRVREILEEMPERDRRLLREVFLEERDKDAVCRDFGVDREYLRVLLFRAKGAFKALYLRKMATGRAGYAASEGP